MGVVEVVTRKQIEKIMEKYFDLVVYIRCYGYGKAPLPYGLTSKTQLYHMD
tara:strand:+ start:388 stop:540 length:153 start_codon:yes stop_codon:yes gene_type:complete